MPKLSRAQREALKRVYDRTPLTYTNDGFKSVVCRHERPVSYLRFRRGVRAGWGCVMVHWCGMWLGIEPDGHTHS
jgi:hypothetical protein